jgi:hypothetical protein
MEFSCPSLYSVMLDDSGAIDAAYFICIGLLNSSCPGLCTGEGESLDWLNWVLQTCSQFPFFSKGSWLDYPELESAAYNSLLPWGWRIQSTDPTYRCPSNREKLASFAVVNVIMSICNLILGRRDVVNKLTFERWGRKDSFPYFWVYSALVTVSLAVLANFINALLVKRAPGFEAVPFAALALFWFTRPRLGWIATGLVTVQWDAQIYSSLAVTSLAAEVILQGIGAFYIGRTAVYAMRNTLLNSSKLSNLRQGVSADLMFSGALIWLVSIWIFYARVIWTFSGIGKVLELVSKRVLKVPLIICCGLSTCFCWVLCCCGHRKSSLKPNFDIDGFLEDIGPDRGQGLGDKLESMRLMFLFMIVPFVGQWLFWVGFIGVAGDQFVSLLPC